MNKLHNLINELIENMAVRRTRAQAVQAVKNGLARQADKEKKITIVEGEVTHEFSVKELKEIWSDIK